MEKQTRLGLYLEEMMETLFFFYFSFFLSLSGFCKQMGDDGFRKQKGGKEDKQA